MSAAILLTDWRLPFRLRASASMARMA